MSKLNTLSRGFAKNKFKKSKITMGPDHNRNKMKGKSSKMKFCMYTFRTSMLPCILFVRTLINCVRFECYVHVSDDGFKKNCIGVAGWGLFYSVFLVTY